MNSTNDIAFARRLYEAWATTQKGGETLAWEKLGDLFKGHWIACARMAQQALAEEVRAELAWCQQRAGLPSSEHVREAFEKYIAAVRAEEREACAQIAATVLRESDGGSLAAHAAEQILTAIRARGAK